MGLRTRKFIGVIATVMFMIVYSLVAMAVGAVWLSGEPAMAATGLLYRSRARLAAAGDGDHPLDVTPGWRCVKSQAASTLRKPFHRANAAPDSSTST